MKVTQWVLLWTIQRVVGFQTRYSWPTRSPARATALPQTDTTSSFSSLVENGLVEKFGAKKVQRVIDAWRRMADGEVLETAIDASHPLMVQECNSYLEGLPITLFHSPPKHWKWVPTLERSWRVVRDELRAALENPEETEAAGNNVWVGPLAGEEVAQAYGSEWKTLGLFDRSDWDETNVGLFPRTSALLNKCGVPLVEALFAKMSPGSSIKAHSDMSNFVLTAHLGIDVPEGECWIQVGNERREWKNGKMLVFDTSVLHEAANESPRDRYVLMLRLWHPDVTQAERKALQFIFDCVSDEEIVKDRATYEMYDDLILQREKYYKTILKTS